LVPRLCRPTGRNPGVCQLKRLGDLDFHSRRLSLAAELALVPRGPGGVLGRADRYHRAQRVVPDWSPNDSLRRWRLPRARGELGTACLMALVCDETTELMELFSTQRQFSAYGPSYWAVIAVFAIGAALLVWIGCRQSESQARRLGRILGVLTAATYGSTLIYSLIPPTIGRSVPLRLTDLATVAAAYALWSQRHWPFALTYYWGLVLSRHRPKQVAGRDSGEQPVACHP
jgi:hypothetical protein